MFLEVPGFLALRCGTECFWMPFSGCLGFYVVILGFWVDFGVLVCFGFVLLVLGVSGFSD